MDRIKLIVIAGPTASGKTSLAIKLACCYDGEIVSADSMQIYKGMDIATAKPTLQERNAAVHHMIDFLEPVEKYSVARYVKDAAEIINDVSMRGKQPFVVGGTGLYIDSLVNGIAYSEEPDNVQIRKVLNERLESEGALSLWNELNTIDAVTAQTLHINNTGRIVRALEVWYLTGETMSERIRKSREKPSIYDTLYMIIDFENRQQLYDRIDKRVDVMFEHGLLDEARAYADINSDTTAAQAIGYKELAAYFNGSVSLEEAKNILKTQTRHYAKRQLSWFRRNNAANILCRRENDSDESIFNEAKVLIDDFLKGSAN